MATTEDGDDGRRVDGKDPVVRLMDLARFAHREADLARAAARDAATPEGRIAGDATAASYGDMAETLRQVARWLDDDFPNTPTPLLIGEAHRDDGDGVPWREDDDAG